MGWKQAVRQAAAAEKRAERESARRQNELAKQRAAFEKMQERERNENIVDSHENLIALLTSLHRDCSPRVDWRAFVAAPNPPNVTAVRTREAVARQRLEAYKPGFFERLFRKDVRARDQLEDQLHQAISEDAKETQLLLDQRERTVQDLEESRQLARRILDRDVAAYRDALDGSDSFAELSAQRVVVSVVEVRETAVMIAASPLNDHILPRTDLKLTASGKISEKETPEGTYQTRYQDFLCSIALRCGSEVLALLPVDRVVCNVGVRRTNTTTGHEQLDCLVALHVTRAALESVNLARVDPSDATKNFQCRMAFKKSTGFEAVEKISLDDQWVTT
jgi:hypothetical protein